MSNEEEKQQLYFKVEVVDGVYQFDTNLSHLGAVHFLTDVQRKLIERAVEISQQQEEEHEEDEENETH